MGWLGHPFTQSMICAFGFGFWPVLQRLFGVPTCWAMVILTVVQIPASLVLFRVAPIPELRSAVLFILLGAIPNGIAIVADVALLGQKGDVITKWLPVMAVGIPIVMVIGGALLLGEPLSVRKVCGIIAACFSIYLLSTS